MFSTDEVVAGQQPDAGLDPGDGVGRWTDAVRAGETGVPVDHGSSCFGPTRPRTPPSDAGPLRDQASHGISAPPGSGKTSLLRASSDRSTTFVASRSFPSTETSRIAAVLDAILDAIRSRQPRLIPRRKLRHRLGRRDEFVDMVRSEFAEQLEPVVLLIDDLHELRSAEALAQLTRLPATCRPLCAWSACRRDRRLGSTGLRLADQVSRSGSRSPGYRSARRAICSPRPGSACPTGGAALHHRTEGWAAGLRLAVISLGRHADPERFVAEFSGTDRAIWAI